MYLVMIEIYLVTGGSSLKIWLICVPNKFKKMISSALIVSMVLTFTAPMAAVTAAGDDSILFQDDFNDRNTEGWTTYGGSWNASDGAFHTDKGAGFKAVANGTNFSNFVYEADISIKDGVNSDNAGLIFRVNNPSVGADNLQGYYAGITVNNLVQLGKMNNNWKELASIPFTVQQNKVYRMKVETKGSNIDIYIDGTLVLSAVDSTFTQGSIGVRSFWTNVTYDNLKVTDLQGGVDLDQKKLTLASGKTAQLHNLGASGEEVTWTSSNPEIASISSSGLVTALTPGRAIIEAVSTNGAFRSQAIISVLNSTSAPEILYTNDFSESTVEGWSTYEGNWTVSNGQYAVNSGPGYKAVLDSKSFTDFVLEGDVQITSGNEAGLIFRASNVANGLNQLDGYYVGINASTQTAVLGQMSKGQWQELASKKLPILANEWYHLKVVANEDHIQVYVNDNPLNINGYPKFDLLDASHLATGKIGLRTWNADAKFDNIKVSSYHEAITGLTYTNSVLPNIADPFVLQHDGKYYLYGTNTSADPNKPKGFKVYTSTDLVNWSEQDELALKQSDSWGTSGFWAPEVVEKDGAFYMYYVVNERLAVATSSSPLGPFVQDVKQPMHLNTPEIDAHIFTDDNGKKYIYFVRFNQGNVIWMAELSDDMKSMKEDTLQFVFRATQDWELSQKKPVASINEGPFMIKHNGTYYLTYSGNHFESPDYGVGYATAPTPTGPWTKYAYNPIMKSNTIVPGAGHHSLIYSPDGTELFMVYHTHYKAGTTEPRKLAIDRVHFVPQASGIDAMEVWGPTITPQLKPSAEQSTEPMATLTGASSVQAGQSFDLMYGLSHLSVTQSIYAQDIAVTFDPAQVEFVDAESAKQGLAIAGKKETSGRVRILLASIGADNAAHANGDLLKLHFKAKSSSQPTVIGLANVIISNGLGEESALGQVFVSVDIQAGDRAALSAAIGAAQAKLDASVEGTEVNQYPLGSKAILLSAIEKAQSVLNNPNASQEQIDQAATALNTALQAFIDSVNTTHPSDINSDGLVAIGDLAIVAAAYGKTSNDPNWSEYKKADINGDGKVDIADLAEVARMILN
jgi:GH43 family beta-xylosidase/uncharacterized protein YjdB